MELDELLERYASFAREWIHPSGKRLEEHPRTPDLVERWQAYLDSLHGLGLSASMVPDSPLVLLAERVMHPQERVRACHAVGSYLWELGRRGAQDIVAPEALAAIKPTYREYLEPFMSLG